MTAEAAVTVDFAVWMKGQRTETSLDICSQALSQRVCSLVGFWVDKSGWCWFIMREKYYWLTDKFWLKPTRERIPTNVGRPKMLVCSDG